MEALADEHRKLREENAALRQKLEERNRRVRALEGSVLEGNQRQRDAVKRIEDLIGQITRLEEDLDGSGAEARA